MFSGAVAGALVGISGAAMAGSGFVFEVPQGWTDLSPSAPAKNFERLAPQVLAEARSGRYAAYAMDLRDVEDGFAENFNAIVSRGSQAISDDLVDSVVRGISREIENQGGGSAEVREAGVALIDGVHVGRIVADVHIGDVQTRTLMYILPGHDEHAVLTYSATPESFQRYIRVFESAASATRGLAEPSAASCVLFGVGRHGAMVGAVIGACAGFASGVLRRGRRRRARFR
jgi:hypothetical protein